MTMFELILQGIAWVKAQENKEEAALVLAAMRRDIETFPVYREDPASQAALLAAIDKEE